MATNGAVQLNLEDMVSKPTWKEILLDLISTKEIDPWNVDIIAIADGFLKRAREIHKLDLHLPANVILATSILLRYKSDYLKIIEEQPVQEVLVPEYEDNELIEPLEGLALVSRIPPKRQITLDELMQEMERIIKYDTTERVIKPRGAIGDIINLKLQGMDIEKKMEEVYGKIKTHADEHGWTVFSKVADKQDKVEHIYTLLSVLHLTQKEMIDIKQDEIFGEILIQVLDGRGKNVKVRGDDNEEENEGSSDLLN